MLTDIWVYLCALIKTWAGIISGFLFVVSVVGLMLRTAQYLALSNWLDHNVMTEKMRVPIVRTLFIIALLVAGFRAWDHQYQIANTKMPTAIGDRVSKLEGKVDSLSGSLQALNSNFLTFVTTTAERIPAQATGVDAIRKQALALASKMLSFVADAEKRLPPLPPSLPPDRQGEYENEKLGAERVEASKFSSQNKAQIEFVLQNLKANGVRLGQPDELYTEPLTFRDMLVAATEMTLAANRLPTQ